MLVVIPFALALASPAPEELFRLRGEIATADVKHSSPVLAAAVGDRDGDGNEPGVLANRSSSRSESERARTAHAAAQA